MKGIKNYYILLFLAFLAFSMFSSCASKKKYDYYANIDNYISVIGTVSYINQSEDNTALYFEFDNMSVQLTENFFKVVDGNLKILQKNLKGEELQIGDVLEFVTAPRYFGDGYVMPIVSIKKGEIVLLDFQEGVDNLLRWIDSE